MVCVSVTVVARIAPVPVSATDVGPVHVSLAIGRVAMVVQVDILNRGRRFRAEDTTK